DVFSIADHHHHAAGFEGGESLGKGIETHGANHEDEIFLTVSLDDVEQAGAESLGEIVDRRKDASGIEKPIWCGKKEFAHLEHRDKSAAGAIGVQHGQHADVALVHDPKGIRDGRVRQHTDDVR